MILSSHFSYTKQVPLVTGIVYATAVGLVAALVTMALLAVYGWMSRTKFSDVEFDYVKLLMAVLLLIGVIIVW
jgi:hypothetical protein